MNKTLRIENFWILTLWAVLFMLILSWDQEKIVVLNLVLFSYFLYYLVGSNINTTLSQRRLILLESLLADINLHLETLNLLVTESKRFFSEYRILILVILKKLSLRIQNLLLTQSSLLYSVNHFYLVQSALQQAEELSELKMFEQNNFVSSIIVEEGLKILDTEEVLNVEIETIQ